MSEQQALEVFEILQQLWKVFAIVFIGFIFKDAASDFAKNFLIYIKMRRDKNIYTAVGGKIKINGVKYIITDFTIDAVHLRKLENGAKLRIPVDKYWNETIEYEIDTYGGKKEEKE